MVLHIKITGILLIALAFIHLIFPRYFKWKTAFKEVSLINREVMYVHTFFIALMVLLMGILCVAAYSDLVHTKLGSQINLGLGIFWFTRLGVQFFVYSSQHWKGKLFETVVHVVLTALWIYFSTVFLYTYWIYP